MIKNPWNLRQDRYIAILAVLAAMDEWAVDECKVANEVLLIRIRQLMAIGSAYWNEKQGGIHVDSLAGRG